jgi:hypothetical protein
VSSPSAVMPCWASRVVPSSSVQMATISGVRTPARAASRPASASLSIWCFGESNAVSSSRLRYSTQRYALNSTSASRWSTPTALTNSGAPSPVRQERGGAPGIDDGRPDVGHLDPGASQRSRDLVGIRPASGRPGHQGHEGAHRPSEHEPTGHIEGQMSPDEDPGEPDHHRDGPHPPPPASRQERRGGRGQRGGDRRVARRVPQSAGRSAVDHHPPRSAEGRARPTRSFKPFAA